MKVLRIPVCALICVLATESAAEEWLWDFGSPTLPDSMILDSGALDGSKSPTLTYSLEGGSLGLVDPEPAMNGGAIWAVGAHSEMLADALIQGQVQSATNNIGLGARSLGPGSGYILTLLHPEGDPTRAAVALYKAGAEQPILAMTDPVLSGFDQPFFLELSTVGQNPVQLNGRVSRHQGGPELVAISAVDDGSDGVGPFAAGNAGLVADTIGLPPATGQIDATFDNISAVSAGIDSIVVPAGLEQKEGNTVFGQGSAPPAGGGRFQEVYLASDFSSLGQNPTVLVSMAFRPDRGVRSGRTSFLPDFELRLSTTDSAPGSLSTRFDRNTGSDETLVYSGDLTQTTDGRLASERVNEFDYVIDFEKPFVYDPSQGNLLVDWNFGARGSGTPLWDGQTARGTQLVAGFSPAATHGTYTSNGATVKRFEFLSEFVSLQAGDADQDLDFDQFDLVRVQQGAKYLTGEAATWSEGDWNGAPGGFPQHPPEGDGVFDQFDIIAAQQGGTYLTGPYAAVQRDGQLYDGQTTIIYNSGTGEMAVDAPAGVELTSINIDSAAGIFTGDSAHNLGGSFDNDTDGNIFKATFGSSFGSLSFGNVARTGLSEQFVLNDLTVIGSLAGGGDLGEADLVYVPEPASGLLLAIGLAVGLLRLKPPGR